MVLKLSVSPWVETVERLAELDSHFDYVQREKVLDDMFPGIIGFVKQTLCRFSMAYLQSMEFTCRGDCYVLVSEDSN